MEFKCEEFKEIADKLPNFKSFPNEVSKSLIN